MLSERGIAHSRNTALTLLRHWARFRVHGAAAAVAQDMAAARMALPLDTLFACLREAELVRLATFR